MQETVADYLLLTVHNFHIFYGPNNNLKCRNKVSFFLIFFVFQSLKLARALTES